MAERLIIKDTVSWEERVAVINEEDELEATKELVTIATEAVASIIGETLLRIESVEDVVLVTIALVDRVISADRLFDAWLEPVAEVDALFNTTVTVVVIERVISGERVILGDADIEFSPEDEWDVLLVDEGKGERELDPDSVESEVASALKEDEPESVMSSTVADGVALVVDMGADSVAEGKLLPLTVAVHLACFVVVAITDAVGLIVEDDVSVVKDDGDPVRVIKFVTIGDSDVCALFDDDGVTDEEALTLEDTDGLFEICGELLDVVVEVDERVFRDDGVEVLL